MSAETLGVRIVTEQPIAPAVAPDATAYKTPPFSDAELNAAYHAGQTEDTVIDFLTALNAEQRAAIVDAHRLAELADDPINQTFAALAMMMSQRANDIAAGMTDTSTFDTQLNMLRAIPGADIAGSPIHDTILRTERDRELTLASALRTAEAANRKRYAVAIEAMYASGMPDKPAPAPAPVKPGRGRPANGTSTGPKPITDLDGTVYVKHAPNRDDYSEYGTSACGTCPISRAVAQAGSIAVANLRQNATERLAEMSRADVVAHENCFRAYYDAQYADVRAATVVEYRVAE